ncbi:MAG TPA: DUF1707 domain-containing protein [Marmoricola sp.]|jgi:hypothetical protein|nr:DUF1707 domain-containing protein [Marmoricola sp.]
MDHLRLSDAEREAALARLGEHYAAGRLDKEEYDERSDAVWSARTRADLRPVFVDLEVAPSPRPAAGVVRRGRRAGLPGPLIAVLVVLAALTVVTHLPLILLALLAWCLVRFHRSRHWTR